MKKITNKQFEIFKKECERWIEYFGLKNWQIHYLLDDIDGRAEIRYNCQDGIAVIVLAKEWDEIDDFFVNDTSIKRSAFHEVLELLLGRLTNMASRRYNVDVGDIDEEAHSIIRTLENTIYRDCVNN